MTGATSNSAVGLKEYLDGLATVLREQPDAWVRCEVRALTRGPKYITMEFSEEGVGGKHAANVRGGCFPSRMGDIDAAFAASGLQLGVGCKVLVKLRAELDSTYGFKVEILDIDPSYTLGDFKTRVEAIRRRLQDEGNWDRNRALAKPADFIRVAVISPAGAAGLGDFRATAQRLAGHGLVEFVYFEAPFQTAQSPVKIIAALREIFRECRNGRYCAVALIRGGGAASDLTWLADYNLARAVCMMPVPVITGIGHQHDSTLLDEVAAIRCDTPSKAAEWIRSTVVTAALEARRMMDEIRNVARHDAMFLSGQIEAELTGATMGAAKSVESWSSRTRAANDDVAAGTRGLTDRAQGLTEQLVRSTILAARECLDAAATRLADALRTSLKSADSQTMAAAESVRQAVRVSEQAPQLAIGAYQVGVVAAGHEIILSSTAAMVQFDHDLGLLQRAVMAAPREFAERAAAAVRRETQVIAGSCSAQLRATEMPLMLLLEEVRAAPSRVAAAGTAALGLLAQTCSQNAAAALDAVEVAGARLDEDRSAAIATVPVEVQRKLVDLLSELGASALRSVEDLSSTVLQILTMADALDPTSVVAAGYVILRDAAGRLLTGIDQVYAAGEINAELRDGTARLKSSTNGG